MVSDFSKSSTRVHMSVAYLNGKTPAIVTQTGLYENEMIDAFDANLKRLWQFKSFAETNGSGSHHIDIADVDGDGRDEVFDGTTLLNPDGTVRWSIYREHPDIVADQAHPARQQGPAGVLRGGEHCPRRRVPGGRQERQDFVEAQPRGRPASGYTRTPGGRPTSGKARPAWRC